MGILGLYRDNGKENGCPYSRGFKVLGFRVLGFRGLGLGFFNGDITAIT